MNQGKNNDEEKFQIQKKTMADKKKENEPAKLPRDLACTICDWVFNQNIMRIARGVNYLVGVKRTFFRRSEYMSAPKFAFDFMRHTYTDSGSYWPHMGYFRVSIGFQQEYLKNSIPDYRAVTKMEIRIAGAKAVFNYYKPRSMVCPFPTMNRREMCLQVAHDILGYYDVCKTKMVLHPKGELKMFCPQEKFKPCPKKEFVDILMDLQF
jgi:hypothetical protein